MSKCSDIWALSLWGSRLCLQSWSQQGTWRNNRSVSWFQFFRIQIKDVALFHFDLVKYLDFQIYFPLDFYVGFPEIGKDRHWYWSLMEVNFERIGTLFAIMGSRPQASRLAALDMIHWLESVCLHGSDLCRASRASFQLNLRLFSMATVKDNITILHWKSYVLLCVALINQSVEMIFNSLTSYTLQRVAIAVVR